MLRGYYDVRGKVGVRVYFLKFLSRRVLAPRHNLVTDPRWQVAGVRAERPVSSDLLVSLTWGSVRLRVQ